MRRFINILSAATAVLALYNEARRANFIEPLNIKPLNLMGHMKQMSNKS